MNTKHTPGPWGLETVTTSSGICHKIGPFPYKLNAKPVAACVYVDYPGNGDIEAELKANAVLMQAAPDLLAALITAEEKLREYEHHVGGGDDEITVEPAILTAKAAIAKATGAA